MEAAGPLPQLISLSQVRRQTLQIRLLPLEIPVQQGTRGLPEVPVRQGEAEEVRRPQLVNVRPPLQVPLSLGLLLPRPGPLSLSVREEKSPD